MMLCDSGYNKIIEGKFRSANGQDENGERKPVMMMMLKVHISGDDLPGLQPLSSSCYQ